LKGGILEAGGPVSVPFGLGAGAITGAVVTNAGTIGAEGANLSIVGDVANTGTLDANNATLVISGNVTNAGTISVDNSSASLNIGASGETSTLTNTQYRQHRPRQRSARPSRRRIAAR
jgi:hypothetical protein